MVDYQTIDDGTVTVRHRGAFAYVEGQLASGENLKLMRLRYIGSATVWGFALHLASTDTYEDTILPTGGFAGTEAFGAAAGGFCPAAACKASGNGTRPATTAKRIAVNRITGAP